MVDTGIDITHPDLINNLWINPIEMAGPGATAANGYQNGIDDDGNGEAPRLTSCSPAAVLQLLGSALELARSRCTRASNAGCA